MEAEIPLQIVVITRESSGSNLYIDTNDSLMMFKPGETNRRVEVQLIGGEDKDNNKFVWNIYNQSPADVEVAKSGGNVITIAGNGTQCNINSVNDGIAIIRVTHEKADNPLYITIYVTRYNSVAFPQEIKEMKAGTSEFIDINSPTYDNFKERIRFESDNPVVATAAGTSKVALISAHSAGIAVIRAWIDGREEMAEMYVKVTDDYDPGVTRIVTANTSIVMNPRSAPEKISAMLVGPNIKDDIVNEKLWWKINNDGDPSVNVVNIYPSNGEGSEIEISPRKEGENTITIGHPDVEEKYWKTIYVVVSEVKNALTLNKTSIMLKGGNSETLRADIIGGKQADYEKIVWRQDRLKPSTGGGEDLLTIMGAGKEVLLYPGRGEGTTLITAQFGVMEAKCIVTVEQTAMFLIETTYLRMYPEETKDLRVTVKPSTASVQWYATGIEKDSSDTGTGSGPFPDNSTQRVVSYEPVSGFLRITALRPGTATITGVGNLGAGTAALNISVDYDYELLLENTEDFYKHFEPEPGQSAVINYKMYPPIATVEMAWEGTAPAGANLYITPPEKKTVIVNGVEEVDRFYYGQAVITSTQEFSAQNIKLTLKSKGGTTVDTLFVPVSCYYENGGIHQLYFKRGAGEWSNRAINDNGNDNVITEKDGVFPYTPYYKGGGDSGEELGEKITDSEINIGRKLRYTNTNDGYEESEYYINISDGEEHYLLLDKVHDNQKITITYDGEETTIKSSLQSLYNGNGFDIDIVPIIDNGVEKQAIKLSGGKDYIEYDRIKFPHQPVVVTEVYNNVNDFYPSSNSYYNMLDNTPVGYNYLRIDQYFGENSDGIKFYGKINGLNPQVAVNIEIKNVLKYDYISFTTTNIIGAPLNAVINENYNDYKWNVTSGSNSTYTLQKIKGVSGPYDLRYSPDNKYLDKEENFKTKQWDNIDKYWKVLPQVINLPVFDPALDKGWGNGVVNGAGKFYFHYTDRRKYTHGTYYGATNNGGNINRELKGNLSYLSYLNNTDVNENYYAGSAKQISYSYEQTVYERATRNLHYVVNNGDYQPSNYDGPYGNTDPNITVKALYQEYNNGQGINIFGNNYSIGRRYILQMAVFYNYYNHTDSQRVNLNQEVGLKFRTDTPVQGGGSNIGPIDNLLRYPLWYKIEDNKRNADGIPIGDEYEEVDVRYPYWNYGTPMPMIRRESRTPENLGAPPSGRDVTNTVIILVKDYKDKVIERIELHITCQVRASHMENTKGQDIDTGKTFADLKDEGYNISGKGGLDGFKENHHVWRKAHSGEDPITIPPK